MFVLLMNDVDRRIGQQALTIVVAELSFIRSITSNGLDLLGYATIVPIRNVNNNRCLHCHCHPVPNEMETVGSLGP